ncbi:FAD-binding domain-containing protein [Dendrothele bispora CBS 962.96]|uniref:FAD-binding domain-containing protein n=1 Tax=Dendrothele bispora (strain CBS 962.96) TaxID=1314807 RepID=A0A4S8L8C7_DENBC|nr:FAD-binding domain-containing protein [Dendrothele bispora CBS 962.96]
MFILTLLYHSLVAFASTQVHATPEQWTALGRDLGGRLHTALPFSSPCFSTVNGVDVGRNETECAAIRQGYTSSTFRSPLFSPRMFPQWETCQRSSQKCLLDSMQPNNLATWEGMNCEQGSVSPRYIDIQSAEDVQIAFRFAQETGVMLSIKASGHDLKGRSGAPGSLGLWTRNLNNMTYSPDFVPEGGNVSYRAITVGAGVPFEDLYQFADVNNVTIVGGYHQTVTASGGWVMGGGHSILSPVFGLGVDRVLQFQIVTPDGQIRVVNEFQNPDLFWALRGGGGGTFGVVLESTMLVEPQMKLQVASIHFNQTRQNAGPFLEILVEQALKWSQEGWGGHMSPSGLINVNPLLTLEQAKQSMQPAVDFVLSQNGTVVIEELPSWQAFFLKYVLAAEAGVGIPTIIGARLIPAQNFASEDGKASLVKIFTTMFNDFNISIDAILGTPFLFNSTEGATSVTPAWRKSIWHLVFFEGWTYNATVEDIRSQYELVRNINQMLRDITPGSGAYFNEGDVHEPDHEQSFWGDNYPALLEIKRKYDPYGLLDCWQCVGWKGPENERYACYL